MYSAGIEWVESRTDFVERDRYYGWTTNSQGGRRRCWGEEHVYYALCMVADETGFVPREYTQKRIANLIGCAEGTIASVKFEIIAKGLLTDFNSTRQLTTPDDPFPTVEHTCDACGSVLIEGAA